MICCIIIILGVVLQLLCTLYNWVSVNINWPFAKVPQEKLPTMEFYNALFEGDLPGWSLKREVHINLVGWRGST